VPREIVWCGTEPQAMDNGHIMANLMKERLFSTTGPPVGVVGVHRRQFIDVDEFGVELSKCNRKNGWSVKFLRIRKPGHYSRTEKLTVLIGIEPGDPRLPNNISGSIERPGRWIQVIKGSGTTVQVFAQFIETINTAIETRSGGLLQRGLPVDRDRVYLWDNLNSHLAPMVAMVLYGHQGNHKFTSINRPPYQPKYGPIEYKICDLLHELKMESKPDWTTDILEQEILMAADRIGGFDATFDHCGYSIDGRY
jgi:hypothetical protein